MAEPVSRPVLVAIAHPLRLALLVVLERGEATPAELAAATGVREPVVEQAVGILCDVGLVTGGSRPGRLAATAKGWAEIVNLLAEIQAASPER